MFNASAHNAVETSFVKSVRLCVLALSLRVSGGRALVR